MRRAWLWFIALIGLVTFFSIAFAQTVGGVDLSTFANWGSDPAIFILTIAAIVHLIRQGKLAELINGKFGVGAFTIAVGAVLGVIVAAIEGIHVAPFDQLNNFVASGLTYGATEGLSTFIGVNVIDLLFSRKAKAEATHNPASTTNTTSGSTPDASGSLPR